jgi:hypothetical protein
MFVVAVFSGEILGIFAIITILQRAVREDWKGTLDTVFDIFFLFFS